MDTLGWDNSNKDGLADRIGFQALRHQMFGDSTRKRDDPRGNARFESNPRPAKFLVEPRM